jgi:pyridoxal/pyridoxine/pyridoxamine kinase
MKINCEADALAAIDKLHAMGPSTIILKSAFYGDSNEIILLASQNKGASFYNLSCQQCAR